ncbi:MAG: hypothetical protein Q8L13_22250 [Bradyrhizobium sp.]|uniref:GNAT family N-acetyltransferase n=1 Tax=Bradyrhizobium sp. TaxID=376 RepID=UPI0027308ADC|nr:hypothetical protein [Bradyrhizobium sp.]MDP1869046.1 hypothetical protein [Bradyrhizobium sp.]
MQRPPAVTAKIRAAVGNDAADILLVRREAVLAKAVSHYDPVILNDWANAVDAARIARQISDPDYRVLVTEAGGEIIGFAMAVLSGHELKALYTKPNPIGGIGRALLPEIEYLAFQATPYLVCEASLNAEGFLQGQRVRRGRPERSRVSQRGHFPRRVDEEASAEHQSPIEIGAAEAQGSRSGRAISTSSKYSSPIFRARRSIP